MCRCLHLKWNERIHISKKVRLNCLNRQTIFKLLTVQQTGFMAINLYLTSIDFSGQQLRNNFKSTKMYTCGFVLQGLPGRTGDINKQRFVCDGRFTSCVIDCAWQQIGMLACGAKLFLYFYNGKRTNDNGNTRTQWISLKHLDVTSQWVSLCMISPIIFDIV